MSEAHPETQARREMQVTKRKLDDLLDDVTSRLEDIRREIARERAERDGEGDRDAGPA